MKAFTSSSSRGTSILCADEVDAVAVSESVLEGRPLARRLGHGPVELAPVLDDLVEFLLLPLVVARAVFFDAAPPVGSRFGILAAVAEDLGELVQGLFTVAAVGLFPQVLVDADEVELVGQVEPLDAGGQPGNGLVGFQGVELVRAAGVLVVVLGDGAIEEVCVAGHGLHTELLVKEAGQEESRLVRHPGIRPGCVVEQPAPALTVRGRRLVRVRHLVVDGVAFLIHRRALRTPPVSLLPAPGPALFVVGQLREVREVGQLPRALVTPGLLEHARVVDAEPGGGIAIGVLEGEGERLVHELQGTDPIPFDGAHGPSAASVVAALEGAGDHEAEMIGAGVALRNRLEDAPALRMGRGHGLAHPVRFRLAVEVTQARNRALEIDADHAVVRVGLIDERLVELEGILPVALVEGIGGPFAQAGVRIAWRSSPAERGEGQAGEKETRDGSVHGCSSCFRTSC